MPAPVPPTTHYRAEIDGLRALAIIPVIGFHAQVPGFSGGFIGVDIFLFLSGYLICNQIRREADIGAFSLIGFYERRVRRILPALIAMLTACLMAGFILLPGDFRRFGTSLSATALMAANVLFARGSGYFGMDKDSTPLLHCWSLAVEEQLYLLFPIALMLARRWGNMGIRAALLAAGVLSLAYSIWAVRTDPTMAFYSPMSRGWEFLAGALLASWPSSPSAPASAPAPDAPPNPARRAAGDGAAVAGMLLLGGALWWLDAASAFPGINAVPPILGAALLLTGSAVPGSRFARILQCRPLVVVGRMSYSLYLWHWPLIVFGTYYVLDDHAHAIVRWAMGLLAFPVAWLSWRYIELPFRKPRLLLSRAALFTLAIAATALLALAGLAIRAWDGLPGRFDPVIQRMDNASNIPDYGCTGQAVDMALADPRCRLGDPAAPARYLLWGDSHAAVYQTMLAALSRKHGVSGYSITTLGCPPFFAPDRDSTLPPTKAEQTQCAARNQQTLRFLTTQRPAAVLIAAQWAAYSGTAKANNRKHHTTQSIQDNPQAFTAGIKAIWALGIRVYIVLDVPQTARQSTSNLTKARVIGATWLDQSTTADHRRRTAQMRNLSLNLQRQGLVQIIDPATLLCGPHLCQRENAGYPLYYDSNHLNAQGAAFVAPLFDRVVTR